MKSYIPYEYPNVNNREHTYEYTQRLLQAINESLNEPAKLLSYTKEDFLNLEDDELDEAMDEICCARTLYEHLYYTEKDCVLFTLRTLLDDMELTIKNGETKTIRAINKQKKSKEFHDFQELLFSYIPDVEEKLMQKYKEQLLKYQNDIDHPVHSLKSLFETAKQNTSYCVYAGIGPLYIAACYPEIAYLKEKDFVQAVLSQMQTRTL
ncbi:MAG: hypothetical protein HFF02_09565 [Erysipelotrichaceae bacterium]|nr:hypothetical protein [Erysipelotrichaceae bacterium]